MSYQGDVEGGDEHYFSLSQKITSNIRKISQNVSYMSKMVNQLQAAPESNELPIGVKNIQTYTQKLVKDTSSILMELMKLPVESQSDKLARERLSEEYMATLNAFQDTQRRVAQKTKDDVKKVKSQNINIGDPFAMSGGSKRELVELSDKQVKQQEQLTMQTEREILELEERERELQQLEADISDVNQIFKELGTMITMQGCVVDSIEASVEYATEHVQAATMELGQAATYKNKLRKKKVYFGIALGVILLIVLILIIRR